MTRSRRSLQLPRWLPALLFTVAALMVWPGAAVCEVAVQGTTAAMRVEAQQASLAEILSALEARFQVRHATSVALDKVAVGGVYSGTLEDVLKRLLAGVNYVIRMREGGAVEITIVGWPGDPPPPVTAAPASPQNTNPAAQWRRSELRRP